MLATFGGLLCVGVGGLLGGLLVIVQLVVSSTDEPNRIALVGAIVPGLVAVLGLVGLVAGWRARIDLHPGGELLVRSLPPWGRRTVDCATLTALGVRRSSASPGPMHASKRRSVPVTLLRLRDAQGQELRLNLQSWDVGETFGPAVLAWARRSGAPLDAPTERLLATGAPPDPGDWSGTW